MLELSGHEVKRRKLKSHRSKTKTEKTQGSTPKHPKELPVELARMKPASPDKTKKSGKTPAEKPANISLDYQKLPTSFTDQKSLDDMDPASKFNNPDLRKASVAKGPKEKSRTPGTKKSVTKKLVNQSLVSESKPAPKKLPPPPKPAEKSPMKKPAKAEAPKVQTAAKVPSRKPPTPSPVRAPAKKPQGSPPPSEDRSRLSAVGRPKPLLIEKKVSLTSEAPKETSPKPAKSPTAPKPPAKKPLPQTEPNTPSKPKPAKLPEAKKEPASPARSKPAQKAESPAGSAKKPGEARQNLDKSQTSNPASLSPAASTGRLLEQKSQKSIDAQPPELGPSTISEQKQSLSTIAALQVPKPSPFSNKNSISLFPDRLDFEWLPMEELPSEIECADSLRVEDFKQVGKLRGNASLSPSKRNLGSKEGSKKDLSGELFFEDDEEADLANMV